MASKIVEFLQVSQAVVLIRLLIAHLISDHFLQFDSWSSDKGTNKIKSIKLYYHIALTFVFSWIFSGNLSVAFFIGITHFFIDLGKAYIPFKSLKLSIIDQTLHFIVLIISWLWIIGGVANLPSVNLEFWNNFSFWAIILAYIFCTFPLGFIIGRIVNVWQQESQPDRTEAARWRTIWRLTGIFERILVLTFLLNDQFTAVGLLLIAKIVAVRAENEGRFYNAYNFLGTMLSFVIAIMIGLALKATLIR